MACGCNKREIEREKVYLVQFLRKQGRVASKKKNAKENMKQHHPVFYDNCTNNFIYWVSWYQILWVWKEKNGNGYWLYWKALRFTGFPLHIYIRFGSSPQSHLTWNNVFRIYIYPIFTSGLRLQSSYLQWWLLCIYQTFSILQNKSGSHNFNKDFYGITAISFPSF